MKRILLTGISGVGKSTVTSELAARGYWAVDLDNDDFSEWVAVTADEVNIPGTPVEADRDWVWREDRVQALLAKDTGDLLFVSGSASNMGKFVPQFDRIILFSAPPAVIVERLATRTTNSYGKQPAEVERVLDLIDTVEPLLRRIATDEIDTSTDLEEVMGMVVAIAARLE